MGLDAGTRNGLLSVRTVHTYLYSWLILLYRTWNYGTGVTQTCYGDTGAVVLATKIRLENGNDHKMLLLLSSH